MYFAQLSDEATLLSPMGSVFGGNAQTLTGLPNITTNWGNFQLLRPLCSSDTPPAGESARHLYALLHSQ